MRMDRAVALQHLADAERHVAEGERHLARQEALIAELDHGGHDAKEARTILHTLQETQFLHLQHRDHILKELGSESR
jgi:hypothetical protein